MIVFGADFLALAKVGGAEHRSLFRDGNGNIDNAYSDAINATFEYGKRRFPVQNISWRPYVALDVNYVYAGANTMTGVSWRSAQLSQTYLRVRTDLIAQIKKFTVKTDISYSVDLTTAHLNIQTNEGGGFGADPWINNRLYIGRQIASLGLTGQYDFNRRSAVFASFGLDTFFDLDSRPYQSTLTAGYSRVW